MAKLSTASVNVGVLGCALLHSARQVLRTCHFGQEFCLVFFPIWVGMLESKFLLSEEVQNAKFLNLILSYCVDVRYDILFLVRLSIIIVLPHAIYLSYFTIFGIKQCSSGVQASKFLLPTLDYYLTAVAQLCCGRNSHSIDMVYVTHVGRR